MATSLMTVPRFPNLALRSPLSLLRGDMEDIFDDFWREARGDGSSLIAPECVNDSETLFDSG
ncbi:MAG: hypothetical protein R3C28_26055 [Pirellulaceae bacterium]